MRSLLAILVVAITACSADSPSPATESSLSQSKPVAREASVAAAAQTAEPETSPGIAIPPVPDAGMDLPFATIGASSADASTHGSEPPALTAVRIGKQAGADRLVFEFAGIGLPAWRVEYVDRPVRDCGTGDPVIVAGDAWLQVQFTGAQAHTEAGVATSGPRRRTIDQAVLRELVRLCDFEGEVTWVAGLASPNAYTPRVLEAPARLVIDIAH